MGTQYKFDYEKGYGFTDEVITGTEEYNGKPLVYVDQVGRFSEGETGLAKGSHVIYGEGISFDKIPLVTSIERFVPNELYSRDQIGRDLLFVS